MSQIRYNILKDKEVIIAQKRAYRPNNFLDKEDKKEHCSPFTYGNEHLTPPEIFALRDSGECNSPNWRVRVVPNLYNAVDIESDHRGFRDGFFEGYGGFGAHEVVIETPKREHKIEEFSQKEIADILLAYQIRLNDLSREDRIKHISIFKNHGKNSGASIDHPHSQIIGLPHIPKNIRDEIGIQKEYFLKHKRRLLDDIISEESREKKRVLFEGDNFFVYCPYASLFPFEVHIVAKNSFSSLFVADSFTIDELAMSLKKIFFGYSKIDRDISFNIAYKLMPINHDLDRDEIKSTRFYIELTPRIYNLAGFEIGFGEMINPIQPEIAATFLRKEILG